MLSPRLPWSLAQTKWASELNPVLANLLIQGQLLKNITLTTGDNVVNHLLDRQQIGWILSDITAAVEIYRSQPLNSQTLTLNASAPCTVSIWVF